MIAASPIARSRPATIAPLVAVEPLLVEIPRLPSSELRTIGAPRREVVRLQHDVDLDAVALESKLDAGPIASGLRGDHPVPSGKRGEILRRRHDLEAFRQQNRHAEAIGLPHHRHVRLRRIDVEDQELDPTGLGVVQKAHRLHARRGSKGEHRQEVRHAIHRQRLLSPLQSTDAGHHESGEDGDDRHDDQDLDEAEPTTW